MKDQRQLDNQLQKRKLYIVETIYTLLFVLGVLGSILNIGMYLFYPEIIRSFAPIVITLISTAVLGYIRYFYIYKNLLGSFHILVIFLSMNVIAATILEGADTPFLYVIFTIIILSTSIIISVKRAVIYTLIGLAVTLTIAILQEKMILTIQTDSSDLEILSVSLVALSMGVITYITKAAYSQIEHSYAQAYKYAKRLESINKKLEDMVEKRTAQLQDSFANQIESMHTAAVMGRVTESILHDIATPLSALRGTFTLAKDGDDEEERMEILERGELALKQINGIVEQSKELMQHKSEETLFTPSESVQNVVNVVTNKLRKERIDVSVEVAAAAEIRGNEPMFMRIVMNLLQNAIEELADSRRKDKKISIKGHLESDSLSLSIRDNGRGIKKQYLKRIFEPNFSLKEKGSFGLGLPFVKESISKYFDGEIFVKSSPGKYTQFDLTFKLKPDAKNS